MKRLLFFIAILGMSVHAMAQSMSDDQVKSFIVAEHKAGTGNNQIVTKLMQRGVKLDQIRRVRAQYERQLRSAKLTGQADAAIAEGTARMRTNQTADKKTQELTSGKTDDGTSQIYNEANTEYVDLQMKVNEDANKPADGVSKNVFGRDIFNKRLLSFEPNMNIATPVNYVVGPGDVLVVDIYGASQKTLQLTVSPEGTVTIPGLGPVSVSGLSVGAANQKIRSQLGTRYSSSNIKVTLGQTRSIMVNVMGEVAVPGTYTLSAFASVFHALYMAGGINQLGTLRNIKVYRNNKLATVVDVYDYILNGRLTGNIRLQDNDVISVEPYDCLVGVSGKVKRAMFFEMRKSESLATLVKYAGGFTGDAYTKSIRLVRKTGRQFSVFNVGEFDLSSFKVNDGDAVEVDGILNRYENMVEIKGAVFRPGQYQLGKEITSVRSLVESAEGPLEDAFTDHAVLHRLKADRSLEVIPVDVKGILNGTVADIPLKNEDVLFVPTQSDLQQQRTLTIHGEVMYPGQFQYAENQTLEDLILQAGGLTDAASTARVDISRRIIDPKATTESELIAKTYSFAVKDGFVVDGTPGFLLQPYDEVYVRHSPGFQTQRHVSVEGEVVFAGSITLTKKNMRLSDIVKAAGGVTSHAYVKGARLERRMNADEIARRDAVLRMSYTNQDEKDSVDVHKLDLRDVYPVGIDLEQALANPGSTYDVTVREGDVLVVPEYNGTVRIGGNVMYPNTVVYVEGKDYRWYVNKAGGFGHRAKKRKTYVVYQNGMVAQVHHGAKIAPGCEIIVPAKPRKNNSNVLGQWLAVGTSLTSIAAMVATIANMTK